MTHINRTNRLVSYTIFFLMVFAATVFSDSLVDKHTINTLEDFTFGQTESSMDRAYTTAANSRTGDSFFNDSIKAELEDFRFGQTDQTTKAAMSDKSDSPAHRGDSFVNMKALNQYGDDVKPRTDCGFNC